MFVDASAIVAIMTREPGHQALAAKLDADAAPLTSALAIFEATAAVARKARLDVPEAAEFVRTFLGRSRVEVVPMDGETASRAVAAFATYGKGRGNPAQLNMGDCFAYAMARQAGVPLLYKGNDFAQTDLADRA